MSAKELHNLNENLSQREKIIQRIMNLSNEQFEQLIALYSQQEKESVPISQSDHQTYFQPSA